ncbi:DUF309 domain-containing protein [Streptomonospora wellingtoniae]|uniref:DUF309 domain-containing protein n=1 Tax=Streptomonospora wellingtoniae TaxID=3075544 RepID=A0ABU2KY15_9ACTN|nr:DUF309 domain-containing protein [Streptomonospora sp. DSM 45055]MDT0304042.1 DUF309 domain-containing protein [Streptomonospora sp. DSM 45055]
MSDSAGTKRDRNPEGRAQNQRPRDRFGRPLPHGADGVPRIPDDAEFTPDEGLTKAQRLLDEGYAFHAHEVLEAVWKAAGEPDRELWRGLAQIAVGLTHAQRGNDVGAARLLRRGAERVLPYGPEAPDGVDAVGSAAFARSVADRLDALDHMEGQDRVDTPENPSEPGSGAGSVGPAGPAGPGGRETAQSSDDPTSPVGPDIAGAAVDIDTSALRLRRDDTAR